MTQFVIIYIVVQFANSANDTDSYSISTLKHIYLQ